MKPQIVMVTVKDAAEGKLIAQAVLTRRLAACVNLIPGVESHYWWDGKLETSNELLLLIKTSAENFSALSALIREKHSYECPEIVGLDTEMVETKYSAWWKEQILS